MFRGQNQRSYMGALIQSTIPTPGISRPTPFSILSGIRFQTTVRNPLPLSTKIEESTPKKMKWGEPIWILFHVLAEKVREDIFSSIRTELLNIIYIICSNLPCPDCANHAMIYLNNIKYKNIETKAQLKEMLFLFHNTVNQKKGFPIFPREKLEETYSKYPLFPVLQKFMVVFQDKHKSIRMISDDFHRGKIAIELQTWFNNHINAFST
jgi:hypothetical protein